ncbi:MAG: response regulator [Nitrospinales bacterium]
MLPHSIIIAEDDEDDYLLIIEALKKAEVDTDTVWVKDGQELINYLSSSHIEGKIGNSIGTSLILLDLNMPKKDGREALKEIKAHQVFRTIPVVIFTTSNADVDIDLSYSLGVNSFIQKPVRFNEFVDTIKIFSKYWFNIVSLPN